MLQQVPEVLILKGYKAYFGSRLIIDWIYIHQVGKGMPKMENTIKVRRYK
jgi:hypothetical protein